MVSFWHLVLLGLIFVAVNSLLMFFVIKSAVKSALSEDRIFQAKVANARSSDG